MRPGGAMLGVVLALVFAAGGSWDGAGGRGSTPGEQSLAAGQAGRAVDGTGAEQRPATPVQRWVFNAGSPVVSGPVIGADGTVYAGTEGAKLYAVKPDGKESWSYDMPDGAAPDVRRADRPQPDHRRRPGRIGDRPQPGRSRGLAVRHPQRALRPSERQVIRSNPVIASNYPNVLIGTDAGNLYELDDGAYKGIRRAEAPIRAGAAIAPDGTLIWTSLDRTLYAGVPGGGDRWRKALDGQVSATPAIAADGTVYVATEAGTVFAVRADGSERWHTGIGGGKAIRSGPVLAPDGTVYAPRTTAGSTRSIRTAGAVRWSFATNAPVTASPTVGANGLIYLGSNDGNLYVLRPDGQQQSRFTAGPRSTTRRPPSGRTARSTSPPEAASSMRWAKAVRRRRRRGHAGAGGDGHDRAGPPTPTAVPATPTGPLPTDRAAPREGATYFTETGHNVTAGSSNSSARTAARRSSACPSPRSSTSPVRTAGPPCACSTSSGRGWSTTRSSPVSLRGAAGAAGHGGAAPAGLDALAAVRPGHDGRMVA